MASEVKLAWSEGSDKETTSSSEELDGKVSEDGYQGE